MTDHNTPASPPTALSDLVRDANNEGLTYQAMADRAAAAGHSVSKPYFHKLAERRVDATPTLDRLHGISAALRKPLAVIQRAAASQYLNYETTELAGYGDDIRVIVAHLAGMTPSERQRWQAMIEASERASNNRT